MKTVINGREYSLEMWNEFGPNYRYECLFGTRFADDMRTADEQGRAIIILRFVYAIIVNDNDGVDITFDELIRYCSEEQLVEMVNFYNYRFSVIHKLNEFANGTEADAPGTEPSGETEGTVAASGTVAGGASAKKD